MVRMDIAETVMLQSFKFDSFDFRISDYIRFLRYHSLDTKTKATNKKNQ